LFEIISAPLTNDKCLVCKQTSNSSKVIKVHLSKYQEYSLNFCSECKSFYVGDTSTLSQFSQYDVMDDLHARFYVEVGSGIDSMINFFEAFDNSVTTKNFVDIGCGFGFMVDYVRSTYSLKTKGYERSYYGRLGKKILGIDVESSYLDENTRGEFDIVYSSEVIEHVEDPSIFLKNIKRLISEKGYLIITTPNAKYLSVDSVFPKRAIISPGEHYVIFSKNALQGLLREEGFKNIVVIEKNERLLCCASLSSKVRITYQKNTENIRKKYISYLIKLSNSNNQFLANSSRFRLYKEYVNKGDYESADIIWDELNDYFVKKTDIWIPYIPIDKINKVNSFEEYVESFPSYFGVLCFYRVMHLVNTLNLGEQRIGLFVNVLTILKKEASLDPNLFGEAASLIDNAFFHIFHSTNHLLYENKDTLSLLPKEFLDRFSELEYFNQELINKN